MKFDTLNLDKDLLKGLADAGLEKCTPVQEQSLPESLTGKDIIAQSQTGTGKTAVFIITIFSKLLSNARKGVKGPRALVMAPTRELAVQLDSEAKKLCKYLPFRSVAIYGGVEYTKQTSALREGVDLVLATPGRLIDLYKSKEFKFNNLDIFIIDEADRMFDMGFAPDINYIASRLPKNKARQTMLFSATIDDNVHKLASKFMKPDLVLVEIEPEQITVDKIDQKVLYLSNKEKIPVLMALLKRPDMERVIIFTNMKRTAEMLEWKLVGNDFPAKVLTGDVSQSRRQRIIDDMKSGKIRILVATDVVARGLHIEDISHVINFDLPQEAASYVHRIGRTARAGKSGKAYSLACEDSAWNLPDIEKYIEHKIEVVWVDESEIVEDKAGTYRSRPLQRKVSERGSKRDVDSYKKKPGVGRKTSVSVSDKTKRERGDLRLKKGAYKSSTFKGRIAALNTNGHGGNKLTKGDDGTTMKGLSGSKQASKHTGQSAGKYGAQKPSPHVSASLKAGSRLPRTPKSKEDRIAFYKKKYGENFRPKDENGDPKTTEGKSMDKKDSKDRNLAGAPEEKSKSGVIKRILNVFGKRS